MSTTYVTPLGSGNKSGLNWANAAAITSLDSMVKKAGSGGTVLLAADKGVYNLSKSIDIYGAGVTIKGVNTDGTSGDAHFIGARASDWTAGAAEGNELFRIQKNANDLTFENLNIDNVATAFRVRGDISRLALQNIDVNNVSRFFEDYASTENKTASITGLTIKDVDVTGFSKGAIRLQDNTSKVLIEDVRGNSQRQEAVDGFAIGVHLEGTVHDVLINRTTMENATHNPGAGHYWNGDGFAAENATYGITIQDSVSRGNTDAGFDIKSINASLIRTIAEGNSRNYRIWGTANLIDPQGLNPTYRGGINSQEQIWTGASANVNVTGGTFSDSGTRTTIIENNGHLTFSGTKFSYASSRAVIGTIPDGFIGSSIIGVSATGLNSLGEKYSNGDLVMKMPGAIMSVTPIAITTPLTFGVEHNSASDGLGVSFTSNSSNEVFKGTSLRDTFNFDNNNKKNGSDKILSFGSDDVLVLSTALYDSNKDGVISPSASGLKLGGSTGSVLIDVTHGLRALGKTPEGYIYADAAVRPKNAIEGKLFAADTLTGGKADVATDAFFFDTALHRPVGADKIINFGLKDVIVTTSQIGSGLVGSHVDVVNGNFALYDEGVSVGSIALTGLGGAAVSSLEYDGVKHVSGLSYYVYSNVGSTIGLDALG